MSNVIVTIQPTGGPSSRRTKPRLALRGRRRKMVAKLFKYLRVVFEEDGKEWQKGLAAGYTPFLFGDFDQSPIEDAEALLLARCEAVLAAKI